ncbi:MAG: hypothetical protein WAP57_15650, partial [Aquabacterium commune]|uniref:hypothetical protein n=1 Tax=Aquabacterium commune TaxID=70586 RepID=UPI003BB1B392
MNRPWLGSATVMVTVRVVVWLVACVLGLSGMAHAGPRDGLPQRNLLVEWRVGGQGASTQRQAGIEVGRVII